MRGRVAVLNAARMNFDGAIDFSILSDDGVTVYEDTAPQAVAERAQGVDILVTKELPMTQEVIAALPRSVRLICEAGTGYNNIDLAAAKEWGITVCNIPAYSTQRVAHTAVMLMLCLASSLQRQMRMLAAGDRRNFTEHLMVPHEELNGRTLGVVGAGAIGGKVIELGLALEMDVLVYTRTPRPLPPGARPASFEQLLAQSDYLSLHCPLTPETHHLVGERQLRQMKRTAYLINTSRGALVDESALVTALRQGIIAGAGLDVQEQEPPAADSPLYDMENVILTPHMGWKGRQTRQRLAQMLAENIRRFLQGEPIHVVGG